MNDLNSHDLMATSPASPTAKPAEVRVVDSKAVAPGKAPENLVDATSASAKPAEIIVVEKNTSLDHETVQGMLEMFRKAPGNQLSYLLSLIAANGYVGQLSATYDDLVKRLNASGIVGALEASKTLSPVRAQLERALQIQSKLEKGFELLMNEKNSPIVRALAMDIKLARFAGLFTNIQKGEDRLKQLNSFKQQAEQAGDADKVARFGEAIDGLEKELFAARATAREVQGLMDERAKLTMNVKGADGSEKEIAIPNQVEHVASVVAGRPIKKGESAMSVLQSSLGPVIADPKRRQEIIGNLVNGGVLTETQGTQLDKDLSALARDSKGVKKFVLMGVFASLFLAYIAKQYQDQADKAHAGAGAG